ncbi:MAG: DUF5017 domain-containing protein [Chryseobacterium sp.]|nr:MAG: DUF5017 domain-containing protein [Chryseobacterium sp.]
MKKILIAIWGILALASCKKDDISTPEFTVNVNTENATQVENGIPVFKLGSSVRFNLDGMADMITFYSGEPGMMYQHRDRTSIQGLPYVQFNTQMENGNMPPGFLHVLLSSDFAGFTKDRVKDAENITKATWVDVTNQANLPTTQITQLSPKIDLTAFTGKPLYVAFKYDRPVNTDFPRYQIRNFRVANDADGTSYEIVRTGNAGWTAFDFNARATEDPYLATGGAVANRIWDFRNAASDDRISIGYNSTLASNDWAVTAPIDLTAITPDEGRGIKAYNDDRLREYQFIYNKTGIFTVSFLATNSSYENAKSLVKEVTIKIIN